MASRAVEAINAHRNALLLREQAAMQVQARAWLGVEAELNRAAVPLIEQARQGNLSRDQIQRLERYRALMNQTSTQLKGYEGFMEEQVRDGQRTAVSMAIDHAVGAINASAQEAGVMSLQFNRLPVAAVENMVGLTTTGSPLSSILADASRGAPERLGQELINSIALGRNPVETARLAVRRGLGPTFTRMRTIARTEQLRVYRQVSLATYSHSGVVDEYRRLSARDSRVCPACLFADGRTYPIAKPFAEHPQGRCTTVPVIRGYGGPQFETGEEWFKRQNVETQKKILGNTRYDLWREGKVKKLGDFIEETHNEDWGDSMTTRSLYDVLGHRPVRPDRLPSVVDQYNSSVFSSMSGSGPAEMGENEATDWQEDSMIRGDLWVVKTAKSGEKIRKEGFGNTVFLDIDTDEAVKKAQAMPGSDLIRVKVKVQNPAYVQINPMSSSKDIAEKFFGEPLEKLQRDTGKTDVYEIFRAKGYDSLRLMPSSGKKGMMVIFDPANAAPVKKFDVGGPTPPKPKPKPKVEWKPTMTKEEADSWAEDSQHLGDIYVVKASSNAARDRSFGFVGNVQALTDEEAANKKAATGGEKMVVRARVTNVATYRGTAASSSKDIAEGVFGKPLHQLQQETGEKDVYAIFKAKGYDAIRIDTPSGKNGMLIVLDPKKTTIVTDGVSKPPPPKPPPAPPKPPPPPPPKPPTPPELPKATMSDEKKKRLDTPKSHLTPNYRTEKHGFYVDDDEIIQTKSTKEVEAILSKRYPGTTFDFKGMDLEVAQTTADEYHRLGQKYPEVAKELTYVGTYVGKPPKHLPGFGSTEKDTIAHAGSSGKYIGFNPKYYGDAEKLRKTNKNCGYTGWTVQYDGEAYTPLTHEFGHQVEHFYYNQGVQKSLTGTVGTSPWEMGDKSSAGGRRTPGTMTHIVEEFNKWTSPTTSLSRYATTTNNSDRKEEGWSEAFIKAELFPEEDWDDYTKAHRQLITVVPPTTKGLKEKSTAKRLSELSPEQQKTERGKLQDLYRKAGVLFRG